MKLAFALTASALFGSGAYLLLSRDLVRVVVGVVLISQASVLTLIASGLVRGRAPIYPLPQGGVSDPLSQAMALTAIVIGLGVTAFLLVLVYRVVTAYHARGLDELTADEIEHDALLEREDAGAHREEEAATP